MIEVSQTGSAVTIPTLKPKSRLSWAVKLGYVLLGSGVGCLLAWKEQIDFLKNPHRVDVAEAIVFDMIYATPFLLCPVGIALSLLLSFLLRAKRIVVYISIVGYLLIFYMLANLAFLLLMDSLRVP